MFKIFNIFKEIFCPICFYYKIIQNDGLEYKIKLKHKMSEYSKLNQLYLYNIKNIKRIPFWMY